MANDMAGRPDVSGVETCRLSSHPARARQASPGALSGAGGRNPCDGTPRRALPGAEKIGRRRMDGPMGTIDSPWPDRVATLSGAGL
jgi:hypothetical protein